MAVYKVIQDIEAEDKLLGPLGLRQFIYAAVAGLIIFIDVRLAISGIGPLKWAFILLMLFPLLLFMVLASPLGREQPTEVWLLSRIRFMLKPRRRIWDQSGTSQLVTITAPKKEVRQLTDNLSQSEVRSRLQALAQTLDSRGWAVKNVAVNLSAAPQYLQHRGESTDRLIDASSLPQEVPAVSVSASDDILDEQNNPTAHHFEVLMQQAEDRRRQDLSDKVSSARSGTDFTILDEQAVAADAAGNTFFTGSAIVTPGQETASPPEEAAVTADEQKVLERVRRRDAAIHESAEEAEKIFEKTHGIKPPASQPVPVTTPELDAKLKALAQPDDTMPLTVDSVSKLANSGSDEIVVSLR